MILEFKHNNINSEKHSWKNPVNNVTYRFRFFSIKDVYYNIKDLPFELPRYNPALRELLYSSHFFTVKYALQLNIKSLL